MIAGMVDGNEAYRRRLQAGEVVTPGLVDWGGIYRAVTGQGPVSPPAPVAVAPRPEDYAGPRMPSVGAVQGTKHNRGELPMAGNSLNEPWPGAYDQVMIRAASSVPERLPPTTLPPANYGVSSAYVPDPATVARTRDANGNYSDPLTAIEGAAPREWFTPWKANPSVMIAAPSVYEGDAWGGMRMGDPGTEIPGMATGTPGGAPAAAPKRVSILEALMRPAETSPQQLAAMKEASKTAQDPALAKALAAGKKSYTPTNAKARGVLGPGAVLPTVAMNGNPIRNR